MPRNRLNGSTVAHGKGRPTKLTPQTILILEEAIGKGTTWKSAAAVAGISEDSLCNWRREDPELNARLDGAREKARLRALKVIQDVAERGDYKAAVEFLRLAWPEYRNRESALAAVHVSNGTPPMELTERDLDNIRRLQQA
jgi:hypothetical protein